MLNNRPLILNHLRAFSLHFSLTEYLKYFICIYLFHPQIKVMTQKNINRKCGWFCLRGKQVLWMWALSGELMSVWGVQTEIWQLTSWELGFPLHTPLVSNHGNTRHFPDEVDKFRKRRPHFFAVIYRCYFICLLIL